MSMYCTGVGEDMENWQCLHTLSAKISVRPIRMHSNLIDRSWGCCATPGTPSSAIPAVRTKMVSKHAQVARI